MVLVFTILLLEVESPDIFARMQRGGESPEGEGGCWVDVRQGHHSPLTLNPLLWPHHLNRQNGKYMAE